MAERELVIRNHVQALATLEAERDALRAKLCRIADIIEQVDNRCLAADGPVTPTLKEMRQDELSEIYRLTKEKTDA